MSAQNTKNALQLTAGASKIVLARARRQAGLAVESSSGLTSAHGIRNLSSGDGRQVARPSPSRPSPYALSGRPDVPSAPPAPVPLASSAVPLPEQVSGPAVQTSPVAPKLGVTKMLGRKDAERRPRALSRDVSQVSVDTVQVSGKIIRILFGDAMGSKAMLLVQGEKEQFKLHGALTFKPEIGKRVSASATMEEHPKFGRQYSAGYVVEELPIDRLGAVGFMVNKLGSCMTRPVCDQLYDLFGESIFTVLQTEPHRLLGVAGIGERQLKVIACAWQDDVATRNMWPFFAAHGVDGETAARIYAKFGARSMQVAKEKPYQLTAIEGVGFQIADSIAAESGILADSSDRSIGAIECVLDVQAQNGHTSVPSNELVAQTLKLLEMGGPDNTQLIEAVIEQMLEADHLRARVLDGKLCFAKTSFAEAELAIAKEVKRLIDTGRADDSLAASARSKAEEMKDVDQADAVANVFESPVSVITGRPGCGKTTVVKVITEVAKASRLRVVMGAPTGKAARRLGEATNENASTVHSLLKPEMGAGPDVFQHGTDNPLKGDIFAIDESSMMDTMLTLSYLRAIPSGSRVVFVGDFEQLPSVSAGCVLRDIITSGHVPVARLQTIHRTAMDSDIVVNAHRIINGDYAAVDLKGKKDFKFHQAVDDHQIHSVVLDRYLGMVRKYGVDSVQVLCARRGTSTGVDSLNALIRPIINPASPEKKELTHQGQMFREGDRVMRTSNNKNLRVANGEVGLICHIDVAKKLVSVHFGDREVVHDAKEMRALCLAYATTIHKSQGSEYAGVITVVSAAHRGMLNRSLIYTAITRGKKESDIIGDPSVLRSAISKSGTSRCTGLADEIRFAFGEDRPVAVFRNQSYGNTASETSSASRQVPVDLLVQQMDTNARSNLFRRVRP